ncbi:hypothetical protein NQZ68_026112 [Dissostichus eleginoides]|nr:hypothetical protein NQZ68_026112 [Dissostichus eleginoides]
MLLNVSTGFLQGVAEVHHGRKCSQRGSWFVPSSVHPLFVSQLSPSADILIAVFLTFTFVTSVVGNGMSLLMFCRRRKKLRPPELMIINLALCDLGFSLLGAPFSIISRSAVLYKTANNWVHLAGLGSSRTLASIPSASVSHSGKDLRLAKMAAVVCASFLIAWMPYATISLISALIPSEDQEASLHSVVEESSSANPPKTLDIPSLLNWTATEYYRHIYYNPESRWSGVEMNSASIASPSEPSSPRSAFSPLVSLIPAMLAKSHTMLNPLIYHIINREFRYDMYAMIFGQVKAEKRQLSTNLERHSRNLSKQKRRESKSKGRFNSWADTTSVGGTLNFNALDTEGLRCSTSSTV